MISSCPSLPFVIIFERHWDEEPKKLVKELIPKLCEEGYDTLCFEAPQNLTEDDILSSHSEGLKLDSKINSQAYEYLSRVGIKDIVLSDLGFKKLAQLIKIYVSSQRYLEVTEKIKGLPASILLKNIFSDAKRYYFSIKGVDIDANDFASIISLDLSQRMRMIEKKEDCRISTIFENLLSLHKAGKNVVFVCGGLHAENLINKFEKKGLQGQVLYYLPHSDKNYDDSVDDLKEYLTNETLKDHTFCLIDEPSRNLLKEKIIKEIKSSNVNYKEEVVGGNSHSQFLSEFFNKNFKAYLRTGYYVDSLLDTTGLDDCENIIKKLEETNISTNSICLEGRTHLVIRDVNTKEVASNLQRLQ